MILQNNLQLETGLVLIGIESQDYLEFNISENVETNKNTTEKIIEEIKQKIFKPMFDNLEEIIKKDLKNKVITWQQNLDFILSGGSYTSFIKETRKINTQQQTLEDKKVFDPLKIDDLKNKFTI